MAKKPNQKIKLLFLKRILLEKTDAEHALTLSEISAELGKYDISAERKSLYDDLEALKLYGLDIAVHRDRQVRYYVANRNFSPAELKLLVDAVQASKAITHRKSIELIRKLEALGSKHTASQLHEQLNMENRLKAANEEIFANVEKICSAIAKNMRIRCKYFEWNSRKQRLLRNSGEYYELSPMALNWDDENYYLVAFDSKAGKVKHFRVDKMLDVTVLDTVREHVSENDGIDMALYSRQVFGMYGGESCNVRIRCDNSLASVVIDRFGQDVTILSNTDTDFEFAAKVMISPTFFSWVMGFGNKMKIISPDYVAHELARTASDILELYE